MFATLDCKISVKLISKPFLCLVLKYADSSPPPIFHKMRRKRMSYYTTSSLVTQPVLYLSTMDMYLSNFNQALPVIVKCMQIDSGFTTGKKTRKAMDSIPNG